MKVVALAGGTGSAKLLAGLAKIPVELTVVANVGDNYWVYGTYVCPDVDIACYTLAGIGDRSRGWGIAGDTFSVLGELARLGEETWFKLGDRDMAACLFRTAMLRSGATLTEATRSICRSLGVRASVLPATDSPVETMVSTPGGDLHLQEFWVRDGGRPEVKGVWYRGARRARVSQEVARAVAAADRVVVCPANPVTSVGPVLAIPGMVPLLKRSKARVVALSPMEGRGAFSGPADRLLKAGGVSPDSVGVAGMYAPFLDAMVISERDSGMKAEIERLGVACVPSRTRIEGEADGVRLGEALLSI